MVEKLQLPINIEKEGDTTLHQVLMSLRSKLFYWCTIFLAINKFSSTGDIIALCHSGYEEVANKVIANIVTLYKEQFGQNATQWFTPEAIEEAKT